MPILTHLLNSEGEFHVKPGLDDWRYCGSCKHCAWLVALGQGVSCYYWQSKDPENKRYSIPNKTFNCLKYEPKFENYIPGSSYKDK